MGKLHIIHLKRLETTEWELRFQGYRKDFMEMIESLKYERCRWDPEAYEGKGAWQVDDYVLQEYGDRFDNLAALTGQPAPAATINDCPF